MANNQGWKIDKHIPVALLATLIIHLCGTVWAVAKFTSHIDNIDQAISAQTQINSRQDEKIEAIQNVNYSVDKRLSMIENAVLEIKENVKDVKGKR